VYLKVHNFYSQRNTGFKSLRWLFLGCFMRFLLTLLLGLVFSGGALADKNLGLPPLTIPDDNSQTAEKIALGRLLFNDKRFSANGSVSCSSCHQAEKAFADGLPVAIGINGQAGKGGE